MGMKRGQMTNGIAKRSLDLKRDGSIGRRNHETACVAETGIKDWPSKVRRKGEAIHQTKMYLG
ncbi:hypothetical protein J6590_038778 [Homalodisca vitripennis]|nr:hypothetical protein J6590_038778 [Homalodisca vitripennis]